MRDFEVDPIDPEAIEKLRKSIREDGFWGGVVCRRDPDTHELEIVAGHTRIHAAIKENVTYADLFVGSMDEPTMIRIYARENATQRANSATAVAGSIASAIRWISKAVLLGGANSRILELQDMEHLRRHLTSDRGIGEPVIVEFLKGVPGITKYTVEAQLRNLKSSGHYARIIEQVQREIAEFEKERLAALARKEKEALEKERQAKEAERELEQARKRAKAAREEAERQVAKLEQERAEIKAKAAAEQKAKLEKELKEFDKLRETRDSAEKAVEHAKKDPVVFDYVGVSKYLKNEHQIDVFRKLVTTPDARRYLALDQQEALAEELLNRAGDPRKLSGEFITNNFEAMMTVIKAKQRKLDVDERAELERRDEDRYWERMQEEFVVHLKALHDRGLRITEWLASHRDRRFQISPNMRSNIRLASDTLAKLAAKV